MDWRIHHANILDFMPELPYDALFADYPYHLGSITKRYSTMPQAGVIYDDTIARANPYARTANGFMNANWDQGSLFIQPSTWAHLLQWVKPGGFQLAFTSPVTHHRFACAMEDGGWDIHPCIYNYVSGQLYELPLGHLGWVYAGGMPKATNISYWFERELCVKLCPCGYYGPLNGNWSSCPECGKDGTKRNQVHWHYADNLDERMRQKPPYRHPTAQRFAGHRYGHQALAPAFEPIIMAQRPYDAGTRPVDQIEANGAGCLNVDGCRVPLGENKNRGLIQRDYKQTNKNTYGYGLNGSVSLGTTTQGRWPSNLILTCHCDPLRPDPDSHDPACPVYLIGAQSGVLKGGSAKTGNEPSRVTKDVYGEYERQPYPGRNDSGTAARYYYNADWSYELYEAICRNGPGAYSSKVKSQDERDAGVYGDLLQRQRLNAGGLSEEPRWAKQARRNNHPTLKSLKLTTYLATLLAPPDHYAPRRLGIPCCGTFSEGIGAMLSGQWEFVEGIELTNTEDSPYYDIAVDRATWWAAQIERGFSDIDAIIDEWRREMHGDRELSPNGKKWTQGTIL